MDGLLELTPRPFNSSGLWLLPFEFEREGRSSATYGGPAVCARRSKVASPGAAVKNDAVAHLVQEAIISQHDGETERRRVSCEAARPGGLQVAFWMMQAQAGSEARKGGIIHAFMAPIVQSSVS